MKKIILYGALCIVILSTSNCSKEPQPFENLPAEVNLGESVVYLNGSLEPDYKPEFKYIAINDVMNYGFIESYEQVANILGFSWLPLTTGNFELHTERIIHIKAKTSFNQLISEDLPGYSYELEDPDEGFFNVEYLDTTQQIVKGRFQAKFKRTSKNGNGDTGLPKILLFQGVFHERYEKH